MACLAVHALVLHSLVDVVRVHAGLDDARVLFLLLQLVAHLEAVEQLVRVLVVLQVALAAVAALVPVAVDDGRINRLPLTLGAPVHGRAQVVALGKEDVVDHGQVGVTLGVRPLHLLLQTKFVFFLRLLYLFG